MIQSYIQSKYITITDIYKQKNTIDKQNIESLKRPEWSLLKIKKYLEDIILLKLIMNKKSILIDNYGFSLFPPNYRKMQISKNLENSLNLFHSNLGIMGFL